MKYGSFVGVLLVLAGTAWADTAPAAETADPFNEALAAARARWAAPEIAKRIDEGIERNRKGDAVVQVVDAEGRPVAGAEIKAVQTSHAFLFGANLFVLGQLASPELNAAYEKAFTGLFNFASLPFYWKDLEPEQGALRFEKDAPYIWRRPPPGELLAWCKAQGITPKGHPLLWHSINPDWMPKDVDALHEAYIKRFKEIAGRFAAEIPIWDVVNESLVCPESYPLYTEDRAYVPWAFDEVHKLFASSTDVLMINEVMMASHAAIGKSRYYEQVKRLLEQGTGVEGIGFQFHFFARKAMGDVFFAHPDMTPANLLDVYENFDDFNLPLYITEITIPGSGPDGPAIQAEFVENLYKLWFSVKNMAGITWWNLVDNTAYGNENAALAGLVDEKVQPKPAYETLDRLINHEWKTQFKGVTDAEGRCTFRGFAGAYEVEIAAPGQRPKSFTMEVEAGKENAHTFNNGKGGQ